MIEAGDDEPRSEINSQIKISFTYKRINKGSSSFAIDVLDN